MRDLLLLSYDDQIVSDEEHWILYQNYISKNHEFPYRSYSRFDLEDMDEDECLVEFRVLKMDIPVL